MNEGKEASLEIMADIVSAYVSNNSIASNDLAGLIANVHQALLKVAGAKPEQPAEAPIPAVSIKKSITADHLICLEDGKKFKSLKRHLRTGYEMSPQAYREKWGLPSDYPMVAPSYSQNAPSSLRRWDSGKVASRLLAPLWRSTHFANLVERRPSRRRRRAPDVAPARDLRRGHFTADCAR